MIDWSPKDIDRPVSWIVGKCLGICTTGTDDTPSHS